MCHANASRDDDDSNNNNRHNLICEMGRATSKGNEVKSEMKQPGDIPTPRF